MADARGRSGSAAGTSTRRVRIEPIHGNARRRTIALLAVTAVVVLGVHYAVGRVTAGSKAAPTASADRTKTSAPDAPAYYVSAVGDDNADGTTPETAWRTLARADQHTYLPGEKLMLRGGDTFGGQLTLKSGEAGQADKPVVITSYGTGAATIKAGQTPAVSVFDTAGVTVQDLVVVGDGALKSPTAGIDVYNDLPGDQVLDGVTVTGVDVSGFRDGVSLVGGNGSSGFSDVTVSDSKLHNNRDNGLVSDGPEGVAPLPKGKRPFRDIHVSGVVAFDNAGNPANHKTSTGSGIDLGGVDGVRIEDSMAYGNGGSCDSSNGPVGIWVHDASDAVITHNVSYGNRTAGFTDGGGFDLDQNTQDSVLEQNLTYGNWGPGYMVYSGAADVASSGNAVRYNVSVDDAQGPKDASSITYGAMMLAGFESDLSVHHNTIRQSTKAQKATLLNLGGHLLIGLQLKSTAIRDNIFAAGGGALLDAGTAPNLGQVVMQGNDYYSAAGHWLMKWGATSYKTLAAWRKATGQERLKSAATGTDGDPKLGAAGAAPWDPTHTAVPVPGAGGAAVKGALDVTALFGTDAGTEDYLGNPVAGDTALGAVARTGA